jgi:4-carboxymuconolactone decarboxylase
VDYRERLRRLAWTQAPYTDAVTGLYGPGDLALDPKTLALVHLAAAVAVGGALTSFGAMADAAIAAGATVDEIVDVLVGVVPIVGLPRVVSAAPLLALGLGYDTDAAL